MTRCLLGPGPPCSAWLSVVSRWAEGKRQPWLGADHDIKARTLINTARTLIKWAHPRYRAGLLVCCVYQGVCAIVMSTAVMPEITHVQTW